MLSRICLEFSGLCCLRCSGSVMLVIVSGRQGALASPDLDFFGRIFVSSKYMLTVHIFLSCPSQEKFMRTPLSGSEFQYVIVLGK